MKIRKKIATNILQYLNETYKLTFDDKKEIEKIIKNDYDKYKNNIEKTNSEIEEAKKFIEHLKKLEYTQEFTKEEI